MAKATPGDPRAAPRTLAARWRKSAGRSRSSRGCATSSRSGSRSSTARCGRSSGAHERRSSVGESRDRLSGLAARRHSSAFSARERAVLALAEALTLRPDTRAIAAARREAAAEFDEPELAELVVACAWSNARDRMELVGGAARTAPPLA
jgi:hypothetical protein